METVMLQTLVPVIVDGVVPTVAPQYALLSVFMVLVRPRILAHVTVVGAEPFVMLQSVIPLVVPAQVNARLPTFVLAILVTPVHLVVRVSTFQKDAKIKQFTP